MTVPSLAAKLSGSMMRNGVHKLKNGQNPNQQETASSNRYFFCPHDVLDVNALARIDMRAEEGGLSSIDSSGFIWLRKDRKYRENLIFHKTTVDECYALQEGCSIGW